MRIANHEDRLAAITGEPGQELAHDVEKNSGGRFGPEPQAPFRRRPAPTPEVCIPVIAVITYIC